MKQTYKQVVISLITTLLLAGCYGKGEPVVSQPLPDPDPTPLPDGGDNLELSICTPLFQQFAAAQAEGKEAILLDFSYAGYAHGEQAVPVVDYPEVSVDDFGAKPNDGQSDRQALIEAIKKAEELAASNSRGAVVRFSAGRYDLHTADEQSVKEPITIQSRNIVLRGCTDGSGRTELYMEYPNEPNDNTLWNSNELIMFTYPKAKKDEEVQLTTLTADAPRGSHTIQVASASGLSMGQRVLLKMTNNAPHVVAAEVAPYPVESEWTELPNEGVQVAEYHEIARVEGTKITLKEPLMHKVVANWGWTLHRHQHVVGCGVEHIDFRGNFKESFSHHLNALHDSGFRMVTMRRQVNSWMVDCHFTDVSEALSVMLSANVSVLGCSIKGNAGHSAIRSQASSFVLIGGCNDQAGQYHSFGVSKTASGTVLWRNVTVSSTSFESHCSQPRATLIDYAKSGFMPNHAGGDAALGPNHLADLVLWNFRQSSAGGITFNLWQRNNRFLKPIIVGYQGSNRFLPEQVTADESHGKAVYPYSLYQGQLMLRLGYLPEWTLAYIK